MISHLNQIILNGYMHTFKRGQVYQDSLILLLTCILSITTLKIQLCLWMTFDPARWCNSEGCFLWLC